MGVWVGAGRSWTQWSGWWALRTWRTLVRVSETKLRIWDPEERDCFAGHLHMTMTGAEQAAVSQSLISCNKTDSAIPYPWFYMWGNRCIPGLAMRAWTGPSPSGPSPSGPQCPVLAKGHRRSLILEGRKERPEGSGGQRHPSEASPLGPPLIVQWRLPQITLIFMGSTLDLPPPHDSLAS